MTSSEYKLQHSIPSNAKYKASKLSDGTVIHWWTLVNNGKAVAWRFEELMPLHEFLCGRGHLTEKIIHSMTEAAKVDFIECPKCGEKAGKQLSIPFPAHLHGSPEGYHKPSPCAKRVVNPDTLFFDGKGYAKNSKTK